MENHLYQVLDPQDLESTEYQLQQLGLQDIYSIIEEETSSAFIGGRCSHVLQHPNIILKDANVSLSWEDQWQSFAENFQDGKAHISLESYGFEKQIFLWPGEGFGDLSHPTTKLVLDLMHDKVHEKVVIDIGSGSGILSFCAIAFGAKKAIGIDIDDKAIEHAQKNAQLNNQTSKTIFSKKLPPLRKTDHICLMNMILPEQIGFNPSKLSSKAHFWITSGILVEQKDTYLKHTQEWGWEKIQEKESDGWLGFVFKIT